VNPAQAAVVAAVTALAAVVEAVPAAAVVAAEAIAAENPAGDVAQALSRVHGQA
jgi:hypothetical protein